MNKVIDLNENIENYHYWSNACGELHHWGEYDITEDDLPYQLYRLFAEIYSENSFGLDCYLVQYGADEDTYKEYGLSLEAHYDTDYARDICVPYDEVLKTAMIKADLIANRFPECKVFFGKDVCEWNDGSKDSVLAVLLPYNISKEDYNTIGNVVGRVAY
jgi:hypothetical protein